MAPFYYNPNAIEEPDPGPEVVLICPVCGKKVYGDEKIYMDSLEVIGCEHCIRAVDVWDFFNE